MSQQVEIVARVQDVFPKIAVLIRFRDGAIDDIQNVAVFPANINEAPMRLDGASRDHHAFDELVRVHLHQRPVFAGARLGFIRVADHVFFFRRILRHERPLHARREARAAAPAEIRLLHFFDDGFGRHLFQRFCQRLIAALPQVYLNLVRILDAPVLADQRCLGRMAHVQRAGSHRLGLRTFAQIEFFDDPVELERRQILEKVVVDLHGWRARAGADAFHLFE